MDEIIKHGWHWTFGWLRRPELDQQGYYCYEEPDGDLVLSPRPAHAMAMYLDCRRDPCTGELYTCMASIPRRPMKNAPSAKPTHPSRNS